MIMWAVIIADFIILNVLILLFVNYYPKMCSWEPYRHRVFWIMTNVGLLVSHYYSPPIIHLRVVGVGEIIRRIMTLVGTMAVVTYLLVKALHFHFGFGVQLVTFSLTFFVTLLFIRFVERNIIKAFRKKGRNTRSVVFIGNDSELIQIYNRLKDDVSKGYQVLGYYADTEMEKIPENIPLNQLGTLQSFLESVDKHEDLVMVDEIYVSMSRLKRDVIRKISNYCDQKLVRFYYVPVSVETMGIELKRELLDDMEIFTPYENPLLNPVNKAVKRLFDIVLSIVFLIPTALIFPFVWIIMKIQSPGPVFFKQLRTGLDGKDFEMLKFRSMHVNADADKVQATKDDPRKYPFGNFMRKSNIDELPQFLNVLKGDMSIVGPRPHMLAHTEQYSQLIDKYMVRHFVKPGVTGWAQVTGFRGETSELWQMEGRVKRDIWYMEHWSIWLDIRIIWMTIKTIFVHDRNAY